MRISSGYSDMMLQRLQLCDSIATDDPRHGALRIT